MWIRGMALGLGLAAGTPAWADDPTPTQSDGEGEIEESRTPSVGAPVPKGLGDEIVVFGEREIVKRRRALDRRIRAAGYRPGIQKDGRVVYRPEVVWKPTVVVYDDGFVILRRSRVRFEPWVRGKTKAVWLSCIPPFTLMCIKLGGRLVSPARLSAQKERTLRAMDRPLDDWQEAIVSTATRERLDREIPDQLDALWQDGTPMKVGVSTPYVTPAARREAMLTFWSSRACTPEGAAAREVAALFLEYEVQSSPFPVSVDELARANRMQRCDDRLELTIPNP